MSTKEATVSVEVSTEVMLKPTTTVAQTVSSEFVKLSHLSEYCRKAEKYLKECEDKIQMLTCAKNDKFKLKEEYLTRNKINLTNCESLLQAKNELNKYKCELKSAYITTEKALKFRRLKYKKIIFSYESDWQRTLAQYSADPVVEQFLQLEKENAVLQMETEQVEKLTNATTIQFAELEKNVKHKFLEKVVDFSKWMLSYKNSWDSSHKKIAGEHSMESRQVFESDACSLKFSMHSLEDLWRVEPGEDTSSLSVDVSLFDSLLIPTENLEAESEDDLIPLMRSDPEHGSENAGRGPRTPNSESPASGKEWAEADERSTSPPSPSRREASTSEKESRYFRAGEETGTPGRVTVGNLEEGFKEKWRKRCRRKGEGRRSEEGASREGAAKESSGRGCDESERAKAADPKFSAPGDYDNFEFPFDKTPSVSSDEFSQNTNESCGSPRSEDNCFFWRSHDEKEDDKPFAGFFTANATSPKPSFFKLF